MARLRVNRPDLGEAMLAKFLKLASIVIAAILVASTFSLSAQAAPKTYKNCAALNKDFKYGVAKNLKPVNKGAKEIFTPKTNAAVFNRNARLDLDKDQIVCEVIKPTSTTKASDPNSSITGSVTSRILSSYAASSKQVEYKIEFTLCPGITNQKAEDLIEAYKRAMRLWAQFYVPANPIQWVLMGESDHNCWLENVKRLEGRYADANVWNATTNIMGHCQVSADSFCGYGTGVKPNGVFVQYNLVGSKYQAKSNPWVVHHEAVHLYQMSMHSEKIATSKMQTLPPWFVEGHANLFGPIIASNGDFANYRNSEIERLKRAYPKAGEMTAAEWTAELYRLENQHEFVFKNELGYSLGWLILERVYADYSLNQMHALLVDVNNGRDFSAAILNTLAITKESLYEKIGVYLAKEIN